MKKGKIEKVTGRGKRKETTRVPLAKGPSRKREGGTQSDRNPEEEYKARKQVVCYKGSFDRAGVAGL